MMVVSSSQTKETKSIMTVVLYLIKLAKTCKCVIRRIFKVCVYGRGAMVPKALNFFKFRDFSNIVYHKPRCDFGKIVYYTRLQILPYLAKNYAFHDHL